MNKELQSYIQNLARNTQINASAGGSNFKIYLKQAFGGIYENVSPSNLPDYGLTNVVNGIGQGTYIEKMFTNKVLGKHDKLEFDLSEMTVIRLMDFYDLFGRYHLLKICSTPKGNRIYEIVDLDRDLVFQNTELIWSDITPKSGIGEGTLYNWARWRNALYIVGNQEFTFMDMTGGVITYNPQMTNTWDVIDTGFAASEFPTTKGNDGGTQFLPSTIAFHSDEMYIANDFQVKKAEHSNPYNVIGNLTRPFLGLLDTPPVIADLLRPSTFIINQNGDKITALITTGNFLWIVTNRRFYAFKTLTVLNSQLPAGVLWLDTIKEHKVKTGTFSQKSIMLNDEQFDFLTTNNVKPTIASVIPVISQDRIDKVYGSNSYFIDKTMKEIDWSEAAIGILGYGEGDSLSFLSGKICGSQENNITLMYKKVGDNIFFSKLYDENGDNWKANDWLNNDYIAMYGSSVNGNVYVLDTENYGDYPFVIQTGKMGVTTSDLDFSSKNLKYLYLSCYADKGMTIKVELFINPNCDKNTDCDCATKIYEQQMDVSCLTSDKDCAMVKPFSHRGGYNWLKLFNLSSETIAYNTLDMKITVNGTGYFSLHQLGVVYTPKDTFDKSLEVSFNDDPFNTV